jgi:hypothetical protein
VSVSLSGVGRIPLRNRAGEVVAYATVDLADFARLNEHRWHLNYGRYVARWPPRPRRSKLLMHRVVLGLVDGDGMEGDHINRNPLDNRRSNLRVVTTAQNLQNTSSRRGSTSSLRGVSWDARAGKWRAQGQLRGRKHHIAHFASEAAAGAAALAWRRENLPFASD